MEREAKMDCTATCCFAIYVEYFQSVDYSKSWWLNELLPACYKVCVTCTAINNCIPKYFIDQIPIITRYNILRDWTGYIEDMWNGDATSNTQKAHGKSYNKRFIYPIVLKFCTELLNRLISYGQTGVHEIWVRADNIRILYIVQPQWCVYFKFLRGHK